MLSSRHFAVLFLVICLGCGRNTPPSESVPLPEAPHQESSKAAPELRDEDLSHSIAAHTSIPVELRNVIDSNYTQAGFVTGVVTSDIRGTDGRVAIPSGTGITLSVRRIGRRGAQSTAVLGLYAVSIAGHHYSLSDGMADAASLAFTEDAGRGPGHGSVHLNYGYPLEFRLDAPLQLR